jgi:predicted phosphoribosyltransferase
MDRFQDRFDAGRRLASRLGRYANRSDVLVLALPRGGVPVGLMVAEALNAPLGVYLVRKLGVPGHEELALGAIASGGVRILNDEVVGALNVPAEVIARITEKEEEELRRREQAYRGDRPPPDLSGRTVIFVDDGLATGSSMKAAVRASRRQGPAREVVAVPIASLQACIELAEEVDEIVCLSIPEPFIAVGLGYDDFSQLDDQQVRDLLEMGAGSGGAHLGSESALRDGGGLRRPARPLK